MPSLKDVAIVKVKGQKGTKVFTLKGKKKLLKIPARKAKVVANMDMTETEQSYLNAANL